MKTNEMEYIKQVEIKLESLRSQVDSLQTGLKSIRDDNPHITSDIMPLYERTINIKGSISELKIAFRSN